MFAFLKFFKIAFYGEKGLPGKDRFKYADANMPKMKSPMKNLDKKVLRISYFSAGYHIVEGLASILTGISANSIALLGFGLDSFVESLSGFVIIWQFRQHGKIAKIEEERIEKIALRLIACSFFVLAAYVLYESVKKLYLGEVPRPSILGIFIAIISIIVMPILYVLKYRTGKLITSHSLVADSKQQLACIMLSFALLIGLGLNYLYGFWQADPLMGLVIVVFLINEGISTLKEEKLCNC